MRLPQLSLEQVLDALADTVSDAVPVDHEVRLVVRDRHRSLVWGSAARPDRSIRLVDPAGGAVWQAIQAALDGGEEHRGDRLMVAPVLVERRVLGALVVTTTSRSIETGDLIRIRTALADIGVIVENAVAFAEARARATNLERALAGRAVIEQAKGILMARHGVDADTAFQMLRDTSQRTDVKLAAVAANLVGEVSAASEFGRLGPDSTASRPAAV